MQPDNNRADHQRRLLILSYATLASVVLSVLLAVALNFYAARRSTAEIAKVEADVMQIKEQMADRRDLESIRKSLLRLEKDVQRVSDNLAADR